MTEETCYDPRELVSDFNDLGSHMRLADLRVILSALAKITPRRPFVMAEIGSFAGGSALALAALTCVQRLYCIDGWVGSEQDAVINEKYDEFGGDEIYKTFLRNVGPFLGDPIIPIRLLSEDAAKLPQLSTLDAVLVDGDHSYPGCKKDTQLWVPKIRKGGIIIGHDYSDSFLGVMRAVDELGGCNIESTVWWKRIQ